MFGLAAEANGLDSFTHSLSIRVEYCRSFECCVNWKQPMPSQRSSRMKRPTQKSPRISSNPDEDFIPHKLRGKRPKRGQRRNQDVDGAVSIDEGSNQDIIDLINDEHGVEHAAKEDEGSFVALADKGIESDDSEDCGSVNSSIASGPILLHPTTPKKRRTSLHTVHMCTACLKLYQKAKRMKAPLKNKLLDNDPESMTCDQWVLIKKWRPRKLSKTRGTLLIHVQLVKERLQLKKVGKQSEQHEVQSPACLRSHTFLQRNLRRCVRVPVKKGRTRRKRTRNDSQGSRVAKQPRLHSNKDQHRHVHNSSTDDSSLNTTSSHSNYEEANCQADTCPTVQVTPCTVALETTNTRQKTPKKKSGFRDLLAQLRGSSSIIIRETH